MNLRRKDVFVCSVFEGLCNRINCIACAMTTEQPILVRWAINKHCPVPFENLIRPFKNLKVINERVVSYPYAANSRHLCWFYPRNIAELPLDLFRTRLHAAYRRVLRNLLVDDWVKPESPTLGIHFRRFLEGGEVLDSFLESINSVDLLNECKSVHVASDCSDSKLKILENFRQRGVKASTNDCLLMAHDFDRSLKNAQGMCRDLRSMAECKLGVITNSSRSTVVDSLRGFGVPTYYTYDDGFRLNPGRDQLFESMPLPALDNQVD